MKTILYIQGQKDDIIVIDGKEPVPFSGDNDEHFNAAHLLNSAIDWMKICPKKMDGNLRCYRSEKGTYIQSNYQDKDDVGRLIMFRFYADSVDLEDTCKLLNELSKTVGYHCNQQELNAMRSRKSVNNNSFLYYHDRLIDENGNVISPDIPIYKGMISKFEQSKNFEQRSLEQGFYFFKPESKLSKLVRWVFNFGNKSSSSEDKIYFIQSVFDDVFKFWIENPQSIDDTIKHLNNLSKYFGKNVRESDIDTIKNKSNYGK